MYFVILELDEINCWHLIAGVQLAWTSGAEDSTKFGVGCRYLLDPCTSLRAKVSNASELGFGFEQKLRDGTNII